ncbi:hypothetical protein [Cysteiniphilum marinum]|uniref:hypothetical protein n=1 Tax=Cysteiniphilum marinum TaxID=2774191 RepID=UPI00193B21F6|nr:hypothetical protein [Cysteiniphilum marinum]
MSLIINKNNHLKSLEKAKNAIIATVLCLGITSTSHAAMAINPTPTVETNYIVNPHQNGNQTAKVETMPLSRYLNMLYSGYTVAFEQTQDKAITLNGNIANNAAAILDYLSETYGLNFALDTTHKIITVSPTDNVSYESYLYGLNQTKRERLALFEQTEVVKHHYRTKDKEYNDMLETNTALYALIDRLKQSGINLVTLLQTILEQYPSILNADLVTDIELAITQWQEVLNG